MAMSFYHRKDSMEEATPSFVLLYLAPKDAASTCFFQCLLCSLDVLIFYCKLLFGKKTSTKFLFLILN